MRIGLDLDNTLIDYNALFRSLALEQGLVPPAMPASKSLVRDHIRCRHGDEAWRRLQTLAYGRRLGEASLFPGAIEALRALRHNGCELFIVSHKTRYSNLDGPAGGDFHGAALDFLRECGVLSLITPQRLFFTPSREEKCRVIGRLDCEAFVDDLPEVFDDGSFPPVVRQILFEPGEGRAPDTGGRRCLLRRWRALPFLLDIGGRTVSVLGGGRNSRVFRLDAGACGTVIVKQYHVSGFDARDRRGTEWRALCFLRRHGLDAVPEPLACDAGRDMSLLGFLEGQSPVAADDDSLAALAEFAARLHALRAQAAGLPAASEACFCLEDIARQLRGRFAALGRVPGDTPVNREMLAFVREDLAPRLEASLGRAGDRLRQAGIAGDRPLADGLRMPSPSDFGLHNAIRRLDGSLGFVDFEYFGLDDPAKLLSDVCLHPGMGLSAAQGEFFVEYFLQKIQKETTQDPDAALRVRLDAYLPLWRLKWCAIILNEFLPKENARRTFAMGEKAVADTEQCLRGQLAKARNMLQSGRHA